MLRTTMESTPLRTSSVPADAPPPVVTGPVLLAASPLGDHEACIRAASDVAEWLDAALEAVSAVEPLASYAIGGEVMLASPELEAARRTQVETRVRDRLVHVFDDRPWRCDVAVGAPARVVATAAMERHATLVVAGAGHHGLAAQLLLGAELALQVVRLGDRPVLAVHEGWRGLPHRILCAVDFSPASVRAARLACALLPDDGVLQLLLVTPPSTQVGLLGESWLRAQRHEAARRFAALRALLAPTLPPGATLDDLSRAGAVVDEILDVARRHEAGLIVVGTHGGGFFERLLVGSTASGVMRHAPVSVLCAPPPAAAEREWIEQRMRGAAATET